MVDKVTQILVDRLLKVIESENVLPWHQPWRHRYAMNYYSGHVYTGINRWLLPEGEYMTKKQLNKYNKEHGTNYRFKKGIQWLPVLFMKKVELNASYEDLSAEEISTVNSGGTVRHGGLRYYTSKVTGNLIKAYMCRRYYSVAEIKWFEDESGNSPKSKIEEGTVEFEITEPEFIIESYLEMSGVGFFESKDGSYYVHSVDSVYVPKKTDFFSPECYYSTVFHELAHSTGHELRLNRKEVVDYKEYRVKENRSREELIAEMCSCLLCAESGISEIDMSREKQYYSQQQSDAYIKSWYKYLKDGSDDLIYIASDAEKAFKFILNESVQSDTEEYAEKIEGLENKPEEE